MTQTDRAVADLPAATVTQYPDGPLVLRGDFEIRDVDGTVVETQGRSVALCRCGLSAMKPFCDGNHRHAGKGRAART